MAGCTVLVPVVLRQAIGRRADPALVTAQVLLARDGTLISVVVLLVAGVVLAAPGPAELVAAVIPAG